ncbi:MAG: hypothetical protein ACI87W_002058 [Halieaceae bacterium]|jgi:hypothetical protein
MSSKVPNASRNSSPGPSFRSTLISHGVRAAAVRHPDKAALVTGSKSRSYLRAYPHGREGFARSRKRVLGKD